MSEQRNLILAVILSMAVLFGFQYFADKPASPAPTPEAPATSQQAPNKEAQPEVALTARDDAIHQTARITIETPKVRGSINLSGARLDDLQLLDYRETTSSHSPHITLLSPANTEGAYLVEANWQGFEYLSMRPWQIKPGSGSVLRPTTPVTVLIEAKDLRIERTFSIDENYLISITDNVTNTSREEVNFTPLIRIERRVPKQLSELYILHEGGVGVMNKRLQELKYKDLLEGPATQFTSTGGWLGFTDKYWLVALVPSQQEDFKASFTRAGNDRVECTQTGIPTTLKPGQSHQTTHHVFAGAKVLRLLDDYEERLGFERFDLAVDFGWFYFLTKPLFYVLEYLNSWLGSMGLAIVVLTLLSKVLLYPLSKKSFRSMARMREVTPKLERLREQYAHDKMRLNQEMMALYQKEGANPASGCLPQLAQAPIFFCLYKVFYVTLEMRHAPFLGWIQDLSMPDPTHLFNLFGLLPWTPPNFLHIGVWPILMGATMLIQQRMGPQPADPTQARMMLIMPIMFTFLFASFPAGVVIYWTFSNLIAIAQQWYFTHKAVPAPAKATNR